jgi:hypothetical protein
VRPNNLDCRRALRRRKAVHCASRREIDRLFRIGKAVCILPIERTMLTTIAADGCKCYVVHADEKPSAFLEVESAIRGCGELAWLAVRSKFTRTAIEICPHVDGPESEKLFCVRYACFFNCLPDATSIKSTRPARPNWAVKLTLLPIRGRAHQRDTAAPRCPGHFPARQRQRAVTRDRCSGRRALCRGTWSDISRS